MKKLLLSAFVTLLFNVLLTGCGGGGGGGGGSDSGGGFVSASSTGGGSSSSGGGGSGSSGGGTPGGGGDSSGGGGSGSGGSGGDQQPESVHCIPAAFPGGDAVSGSGITFAYYCPDGGIYLTSECSEDECAGFPIADRACSSGQASEGCTVMSVWSQDIYTCPDALAYNGAECTESEDGTFSCAVL